MSVSTATADIRATGHGAWLQPLRDWPEAVRRALQCESAVARIVVAAVRGSAPREAGTCMLVGRDSAHGTIGGGTLEWVAIDAARKMLADAGSPPATVQRLVLGADLAQCCGGVVDLWIERYTRDDGDLLEQLEATRRLGRGCMISRIRAQRVERELHATQPPQSTRPSTRNKGSTVQLDWPGGEPPSLAFPRRPGEGGNAETVIEQATLMEFLDERLPSLWLYGAGHVGQALARVLATLPVRTTWIDSRRELLADELACSMELLHAPAPEMTVADAPPRTHFIVMTHSHSLDYALCRKILERNDLASVGVIGSKSKAARFRSRLARDGLSPERVAKLRCPIGIDGLKSKLPSVIAVAVAAQLLQAIEAAGARGVTPAFDLSGSVAGCDASADCATCRSGY